MDSLLLRKMPLGLRISLSALILVLLGGYAASGLHMAEHHGPRDGQEGLTGDDITGVYHGVQSPPPLRPALAVSYTHLTLPTTPHGSMPECHAH